MRLFISLATALTFCLIAGCSESTQAPESDKPTVGKTYDVSATPENGEWILHGLSEGEQRFSPLKQINATNVTKLGLAFEFDDFVVRGRTNRGVEATALMEDGVLYFTGPWAVTYAIDARTGEKKWVYDPNVKGGRARVTCCDVVNRGAALSGNKILVASTDGYLIALNKLTGEELWKVDTFIDRSASYSITGAPRIADDVVVIGNGGAEMGVRGYVTAYNIESGEQAWRFFTVPSAGADETADVTRARETWSDTMDWSFGGGGTVWDSMVYDSEQNIIFIGTGNGSPWPVWQRGGNLRDTDNLYLSSIVALDADTGLAKWHYQTTPADSWDYTATQHLILADIEWQGQPRKVIMQAPKNGFFYVLDRVSGELLSAEKYTPVSWAEKVDLATGRPVLSESSDYSKEAKIVTPSQGGAHNWHPMAFSPETSLVYIPETTLSAKFDNSYDDKGYLKGSRNTKVNAVMTFPSAADAEREGPKPVPFVNSIIGWNPETGKQWQTTAELLPAGILATAGNLVIAGTSSGKLRFYDATTGDVLHQIATGTHIMASPMTYELDGEQYLAVLAGSGGAFLFTYVPGMAPLEFKNKERLLVYKLGGGTTPMPEPYVAPAVNPIPEGLPTDEETLALGKYRYERHCLQCHRPNATTGVPNLWNMHPATYQIFDEIVLRGAMEYAGMARFDDILTEKDTLAIKAYIASDRARIDSQKGKKTGSAEVHFH